jgi:hypothetical protein
MKPYPQSYYVTRLIVATTAVIFCLTNWQCAAADQAPGRSLALLADVSDNPLNLNRVEDALFLLMNGNCLASQEKFEEAFASFKHRQIPEGEKLRGSPPMDFEQCVHVSVLLLRKVGKIPPAAKGEVSAGMKDWYLTAAFSKKNGLCHWWYIWESQ